MSDIGWATRTGRWNALLTGKVEWVDPDTGDFDIEQLGWRDRWAIFGIHSWSWWWVRKFGQLRCGCTRNPITKRMVLIAMDCPEHGLGDLLDD